MEKCLGTLKVPQKLCSAQWKKRHIWSGTHNFDSSYHALFSTRPALSKLWVPLWNMAFSHWAEHNSRGTLRVPKNFSYAMAPLQIIINAPLIFQSPRHHLLPLLCPSNHYLYTSTSMSFLFLPYFHVFSLYNRNRHLLSSASKGT